MNTDYSAYVPDVIFEKIPIKNLVSCQDYQRSLSESQILKIVREFDLYQINPRQSQPQRRNKLCF